jgi:hypothetical protein
MFKAMEVYGRQRIIGFFHAFDKRRVSFNALQRVALPLKSAMRQNIGQLKRLKINICSVMDIDLAIWTDCTSAYSGVLL